MNSKRVKIGAEYEGDKCCNFALGVSEASDGFESKLIL